MTFEDFCIVLGVSLLALSLDMLFQ